MKAPALSLLALVVAGCAVSGPWLDTPAANPFAPAGADAPMPRSLGMGATTRKTTELLAAVGADKLEGLKPMKMDGMGGMEGMDHSKMPGMKSGGDMRAMDHSKMPGMKAGGGMEGMDHSKMPAMQGKPAEQAKPGSMENMPGMDHSKMPGMKPGASPAKGEAAPPADAAATAEEMKRTETEMKKASEEMKAKSEALGKTLPQKPANTSAPTQEPKSGDHSHHKK